MKQTEWKRVVEPLLPESDDWPFAACPASRIVDTFGAN
jgi:hypothetical protein